MVDDFNKVDKIRETLVTMIPWSQHNRIYYRDHKRMRILMNQDLLIEITDVL